MNAWNRIRRPLLPTALAAAALAAAPAPAAPSLPSGNQSWYYAIGGASPVARVFNPLGSSARMNGSASLSMRYSCGDFSIVTSVKNSFTNVASNVKNAVMTTAKGAIASLPLYVFQRALPGLYELFQSYSADFELDFDNAVKTCEDFERDILAGRDPYQDWIESAKAASWKIAAGSTADPVAAKKTVESQRGNGGVPFPNISAGSVVRSGGAGQPEIRPIYQTAAAGWNAVLGRAPTDNSPYVPPPGVDMRLAQLFPSPSAAADYAVDVVGDQAVGTCDGCPRAAYPGNGLGPKFESHRKNALTKLTVLVVGTGVPAAADLKKVSAPNVAVTGKVISALRSMPADERAILVARLASEIAIAQTIEEALAVRRMLLAGRRVPEIASSQPATKAIDAAIAALEREIDSFLYEQRVSREITSNTAAMILARSDQLNAASQQVPRQARPERTHLDTLGRFK